MDAFRQLCAAGLAIFIKDREPQSRRFEAGPVVGVQAVAAVVTLHGGVAAIDRAQTAAGRETQRTGFFDQGAGERRDQEFGPVRIGFRGVGGAEAGVVAGKLDEQVLKSAAGAEDRAEGFARPTDGGERAGHADLRTRGYDPDRGEAGEVACRVLDGNRRHPRPGHRQVFGQPSEFERERDRAVGDRFRGVVPDECEGGWHVRNF